MRPRLNVLEPELASAVVEEALVLLQTRGVAVEGPAVERLAELELEVSTDGRLRFEPQRVREAVALAPAAFELFDRGGDPAARIGSGTTHFVPASSALKVLDRHTAALRPPTTRDFVEYVRVAKGLDHLAYLSTAFVPDDVPQELADAWRLFLCLVHADRPVVSGAFTAHGVPRMGRLMELFREDREGLVRCPMAIFTCCPNTPLRWGEDPLQNLLDCAAWGIPVEIVPVLLLGMIAPVTPVGALVLHTAEVLSGLAIVQAVRPGSPVLFGGAPAAFHMRYMTNPMTAVEALRVYCSYAEVARQLELPSQAYMALSDAKANDPQSGFETGVGAFLAALAGIDSVSGPGMLDYVNAFSLEKLVFDDEVCAHAQRFLRPVETAGDLPVGELVDELLRENHLLTAEHTLERWPEELYLPGPMVDRTNWDQWEEQGRRDWRARAAAVIEERLAEDEEPPLDEETCREALELFRTSFDGEFEPPDYR